MQPRAYSLAVVLRKEAVKKKMLVDQTIRRGLRHGSAAAELLGVGLRKEAVKEEMRVDQATRRGLRRGSAAAGLLAVATAARLWVFSVSPRRPG